MSSTVMTPEQQQFFYRNGYLVLPGIVPMAIVNAVRRRIHQDIGRLSMRAVAVANAAANPHGAPSDAQLERLKQASAKAGAAESDPAVLALFKETPIKPLLETAMGTPIRPVRGAQLATLFPSAPNNYVNESGYRDCDTPFHGWHGHLDGLWNGATAMHQHIGTPMSAEAFEAWSREPALNGQVKSYPEHNANIANFTALVGVALSDQREEGAGNLGVLSGAHSQMADFFRMQRDAGGPLGPDGPDWPRIDDGAANGCGLRHYPDAVRSAFADGGERTADGKLWPKPTLLKLAAGDAVIALHSLPHSATRAEGPEPRLMAYFRVTSGAREKRHREVYPEALCDPWVEWKGILAPDLALC